jgi:hypothetical protein
MWILIMFIMPGWIQVYFGNNRNIAKAFFNKLVYETADLKFPNFRRKK